MKLGQRVRYLAAAGALFVVLALIAGFATGILRTHGGDVVVVAWLYLLARAVFLRPPTITACAVVALAFSIELGQSFALIERLGLGGTTAAELALGRHFDLLDLLAYVLGGSVAHTADRFLLGRLKWSY